MSKISPRIDKYKALRNIPALKEIKITFLSTSIFKMDKNGIERV